MQLFVPIFSLQPKVNVIFHAIVPLFTSCLVHYEQKAYLLHCFLKNKKQLANLEGNPYLASLDSLSILAMLLAFFAFSLIQEFLRLLHQWFKTKRQLFGPSLPEAQWNEECLLCVGGGKVVSYSRQTGAWFSEDFIGDVVDGTYLTMWHTYSCS